LIQKQVDVPTKIWLWTSFQADLLIVNNFIREKWNWSVHAVAKSIFWISFVSRHPQEKL